MPQPRKRLLAEAERRPPTLADGPAGRPRVERAVAAAVVVAAVVMRVHLRPRLEPRT